MRLQNFLGINLLVRLKNPLFWVQVVLAVFMPVVVVSVIVSIWNTVTDPTTCGPGDSALAKTYLKPKQKEEM